jgi:hypothetical protein
MIEITVIIGEFQKLNIRQSNFLFEILKLNLIIAIFIIIIIVGNG